MIFLHGRDSTAEQFAEEFLESQASDGRFLTQIFSHVRWVFPKSKVRPSARFGEELSQWSDMWSTEYPHAEKHTQQDGLRESVTFIRQLIEVESELVPTFHIILCGISQGCATALLTLLFSGQTLGGFVGLCGWMPCEDELRELKYNLDALRGIRARVCGGVAGASQDS